LAAGESPLLARCRPGSVLRHVRSWRKLTQHPQRIRWSTDRNLLSGRRRVPGPTPTRHPFKGSGFDDGPVEQPVEGPLARERRLRMRPGHPTSGENPRAQAPDHRHCWLLSPRHRERPRSRAAKPRDELPAPHSITSSAVASSVSGMVMPSVLAVLRLITSSSLFV
jgi:hypothetical protein